MIETPKYIERIESKGETLSTIEVVLGQGIQKFLDDRNFVVVWSKGFTKVDEPKITLKEKIYKTKQGFFLYLFLDKEFPTLTIYYKQEQINELTIFLTQLLKQFKNGTTINK
jgi:hypothetical protein